MPGATQPVPGASKIVQPATNGDDIQPATNGHDIDEPKNTRNGSNGLQLVVSLLLFLWQWIAVAHHATSMPSSLWNGHVRAPMNNSCGPLFNVLRWTVFSTLFLMTAEVTLFLSALAYSMTGQCRACIGFSAFGLCFGTFHRVVFGFWGIIVVLQTNRGDATDGCPDLWSCAWWTYWGVFVIMIAACCFGFCFFGALFSAATAKPTATPTERTPFAEGA